MVVLKKALIFILAITFISTVFCYGTGARFSLEAYYTNIVLKFNEIPTIQGLVDIWNDDAPSYGGGAGHVGGRSVDTLTDKAEEISLGSLFELIQEFFVACGTFFGNLWESIIYVVDMVASIFAILPCLLPWNENALVAV